jgi:methylmalonyl-CoA carboxyltransferase small subunit
LKLQIGIDGKTYEVEVEVLENDAQPRQPNTASYRPQPALVQPEPAVGGPAKAPAARETAEEAKLCRSPVTGIVIKVNVKPGQAVAENEAILVLEAMKMETKVTAHSAGTVKSVRVAEGGAVKANQAVVEFE